MAVTFFDPVATPATTRTPLKVLYRGPLSSCNYDCSYCPFAKRRESAAELRADRAALARFVSWAETQTRHQLSLLFTPWGEGLVRGWYQTALEQLSRCPSVSLVAIQTNLSCRLAWLRDCQPEKVALWCTFHPNQTDRAAFLAQCAQIAASGVAYSVGVVGLRESFAEIACLREELPPGVYLWINAYKDQPDYYTPSEIAWLEQIDPLFRFNLPRYASLGEPCLAGEQAISVDGAGDVRRCHFVREVIGNLYQPGWEAALRPRPCPNATCGCYIGYIHRPQLAHDALFGPTLLARIPQLTRAQATSFVARLATPSMASEIVTIASQPALSGLLPGSPSPEQTLAEAFD